MINSVDTVTFFGAKALSSKDVLLLALTASQEVVSFGTEDVNKNCCCFFAFYASDILGGQALR
jgi:hypothetical protein